MFGSLHLPGFTLSRVLHVKDGLLAERCVVVKSQLGVSSVNLEITIML
jgi:hypothetical protein